MKEYIIDKELILRIDTILAHVEDYEHGEIGKEITELRYLLTNLKQNDGNIKSSK